MKKQNWYALEVTVNPHVSEAVEFALNELESAGTEINHLRKDSDARVCVVGYFNALPDEAAARGHLNEALRIYGFAPAEILEIRRREVEELDWLAEWKKHWRPTETEKFIVAPSWEKIENNTDKIVVRIEPSMAFGTGTHETTRLCLRAIEENYRDGESFLDVGTGTGILAIAASKFKVQNRKSKIVGCDTDEDSIRIAKENARLNEVENIEFYVGSITKETPSFDFVCANLTADVILPLLPLLIEKTKRVLVLSGILREQESLVVEELKKFQISNRKIETDGEWISIKSEK